MERIDTLGIPAHGRKATSFGMLAALTLDGVAGNLPSVTGAAGSRLLGSLTPGSSANWRARPELDGRASFSAYVCRRLARWDDPHGERRDEAAE